MSCAGIRRPDSAVCFRSDVTCTTPHRSSLMLDNLFKDRKYITSWLNAGWSASAPAPAALPPRSRQAQRTT
jgi:hypothetical protein